MKKAKNVLSILGYCFTVVGAALVACLPFIDNLAATLSKSAPNNASEFLKSLPERAKGIFSFSWFSSFGEGIKTHYVQAIILVVAVVGLVLFLVGLIKACVKHHSKSLGMLIPNLVVFALALAVVGVITLNPDGTVGLLHQKSNLVYSISAYLDFGALALAGIAALFFVLVFIFYLPYLGQFSKKAEEAPVVQEAAPVESAVVTEEQVVNVISESAGQPVAAEEQKQVGTPSKVIRRILVHRSGKVIRVLNEHYYDVTTNIYVDAGYVDPNAPTETEQQHFEKIINASKTPVEVAPVAPAPAPEVKVVVQTAPAPAPVAPAPAPVKVERIPFVTRLKHADKGLKLAYNELKSEILSYGLKSRVSIAGDTFRLHTKTYIMLVVAGKSLKLYFALDPKNYKDSTFPLGDASSKLLHKDTPLVFKVKSDLSIRRAKVLIADCAAVDKLEQGEVVKHDHAKDLK